MYENLCKVKAILTTFSTSMPKLFRSFEIPIKPVVGAEYPTFSYQYFSLSSFNLTISLRFFTTSALTADFTLKNAFEEAFCNRPFRIISKANLPSTKQSYNLA